MGRLQTQLQAGEGEEDEGGGDGEGEEREGRGTEGQWRGEEDSVPDEDREEEDRGAQTDTDDDWASSTGKHSGSLSYTFTAADEEKLVDFFRANPCFYDKGHPKYTNQVYWRKVLATISTELDTTSEYQTFAAF